MSPGEDVRLLVAEDHRVSAVCSSPQLGAVLTGSVGRRIILNIVKLGFNPTPEVPSFCWADPAHHASPTPDFDSIELLQAQQPLSF